MRNLKFSICIPTYKGVGLIDDTLKSILSQKFKDYEIIVANDSPEDHHEMKKKLDSYKDSRIRFFANKKNLGYPLNLRRATKKVKNEILFLMAQDDILLGEALLKTHDAFFLDEDIGAVTRSYYQFHEDINKPVRLITPYNRNKDSVISIFDGKKAVQKIFESVGQLSGLAYRIKWIEHDFYEEVFPAHIYPFASITRKHKIAFLKDYTVAVRIPSSQTRFKSSIYEISPTESWIKMFNTVYRGKKYKQVRETGIEQFATNFVGLVQIKNFSTFKNLLREIFILAKLRPLNLLILKFWFYVLGTICIPRKVLIWMVDNYKRYILSKTLIMPKSNSRNMFSRKNRYIKLQKKIGLLHERLLEKIKNAHLSNDAQKLANSHINMLESKNYISSNINDLLWFYDNGLSKKDSILDFGTGGGYIAYLVADFVKRITAYEYRGRWIDQKYDQKDYCSAFSFTQKIINELEPSIQFRFYQKLPLKQKKEIFDGIILYAVIEHIDSEILNKVFKELYRLLKPGGMLYIAKLPRLYSYQEFLSRKLKLRGHSNLYTKNKIAKLLNKYSFEIVKIEQTGLFFNYTNKITNGLFPVTNLLEKIMQPLPINFFSHDYRLIAKKYS